MLKLITTSVIICFLCIFILSSFVAFDNIAKLKVEIKKYRTKKLKVAKANKEDIVIAHEMKYIVRRAYFSKRLDSNMDAVMEVN